jgi:hypothetical protein
MHGERGSEDERGRIPAQPRGPTRRMAMAGLASLACCSLGALLGLAAEVVMRREARPPPGPARFWVSDRDAQAIVALDTNLIVTAQTALASPIELRARSDGGLWVACATNAGPTGPHVLRRLTHSGAIASESAIGALYDLDCLDGDRALVVEALPGGARVASMITDGLRRTIASGAGPSCVSGRDAQIVVGTEHGVVTLHSAHDPGAVLATVSIGGMLADVAPGPRAATWWVLDAQGGAAGSRILLLDGNLATLWAAPAGLSALHLVPIPRAERVWIADVNGPIARRLGPQGVVEIPSAALAMSGADRGLGLADGGALFVTPGALLHLDALGSSAPGQGGFDFLVDIAGR